MTNAIKGIGRHWINKNVAVEIYSDGIQIVVDGVEYPIEKVAP